MGGRPSSSRSTSLSRVPAGFASPAVEAVDGLPIEKSTAEAGPLPF